MTLTKEQRRQLELIQICPHKLRNNLLKKIPVSAIKAICECCLNTLRGNIPLSKHQKNKLRSHKATLRNLAYKKIPLRRKRSLIVQKGSGFLSFLIPAALTALTTLFNGVR